jgi:hypothetical protein
MSKDTLSFYNYINNHSNDAINLFKNIFNSQIESLPDTVVSSKFLIEYLDIQSRLELDIFKNAFLDYFKYKLLYSN